MRTAESFVASDTRIAKNRFGRRLEILSSTRGIFARKLILAQELATMNPEFYLILECDQLTDELADRVYEAGFDDSSFTMRGGKAAIWIRHRRGELAQLIRDALAQARRGGVQVAHVEMENEVFA
jgi:hypothetical protein